MQTNNNHLSDWITYLEKLNPSQIELGLDRSKTVAQTLGLTSFISNTRTSPTIITVAGTNGKGSTVTSLADIYREGGYQVATYTSPHLWEFTERIQLNGQPIDEQILCEAFTQVEKARGETQLTYFEFTTLAALWIFQLQKLDIVILEVGMGGRLDAVNIVDADIAVITTIDLDHQAWLGETREQIGYEKAGICRAGRPLVCGEQIPESVYKVAKELNCPTYTLGKEFFLPTLYKGNLLIHNIALSLMVQQLLSERYPVTHAQIDKAISESQLPGRQQLLEQPVWQLFDVAHNPQSIRSLAERISENAHQQPTYAVFSMLKDKALAESIAPITPFIDEWFIAGLPGERGMTTLELKEAMQQQVTCPVHAYTDIRSAHEAACLAAKKENARVVIFGSFHTVAEAYSKQGK